MAAGRGAKRWPPSSARPPRSRGTPRGRRAIHIALSACISWWAAAPRMRRRRSRSSPMAGARTTSGGRWTSRGAWRSGGGVAGGARGARGRAGRRRRAGRRGHAGDEAGPRARSRAGARAAGGVDAEPRPGRCCCARPQSRASARPAGPTSADRDAAAVRRVVETRPTEEALAVLERQATARATGPTPSSRAASWRSPRRPRHPRDVAVELGARACPAATWAKPTRTSRAPSRRTRPCCPRCARWPGCGTRAVMRARPPSCTRARRG